MRNVQPSLILPSAYDRPSIHFLQESEEVGTPEGLTQTDYAVNMAEEAAALRIRKSLTEKYGMTEKDLSAYSDDFEITSHHHNSLYTMERRIVVTMKINRRFMDKWVTPVAEREKAKAAVYQADPDAGQF